MVEGPCMVGDEALRNRKEGCNPGQLVGIEPLNLSPEHAFPCAPCSPTNARSGMSHRPQSCPGRCPQHPKNKSHNHPVWRAWKLANVLKGTETAITCFPKRNPGTATPANPSHNPCSLRSAPRLVGAAFTCEISKTSPRLVNPRTPSFCQSTCTPADPKEFGRSIGTLARLRVLSTRCTSWFQQRWPDWTGRNNKNGTGRRLLLGDTDADLQVSRLPQLPSSFSSCWQSCARAFPPQCGACSAAPVVVKPHSFTF